MWFRISTGILLAITSIHGAASLADERPNIVFIMSDDHATRAISAYEGSLVETPNIDRIAASGMRLSGASSRRAARMGVNRERP